MAAKPILSRPRSRSLEDYVAWFRGLARDLGARSDLSDAQLEAGWREFWAAADREKPS